MARTVSEIKKEITDNFIGNSYIAVKYELEAGKTFEEQFSKVSLESIMFYVIALAIYTVEKIFEAHKADVLATLAKMTPHPAGWYREKVFRFQYPNRDLVDDKDYYDNSGLDEADITALEVVKFCAVEPTGATLKVKVAKGGAGSRVPLDEDEATGLLTYLGKIADGGVLLEVVNKQADRVFGELVIYYNPLLLVPADKPVELVFKSYVSTLDFDGMLAYNKLTDAIQQVQGVELVDVKKIEVQRAANPKENLGVQKIAESGYWVVADDADLIVTYKVYKHENI